MNAFVSDVDQTEFATAVIDRSHTVPIVVDFWAEWCGPCKQLSPVLERLADEFNGGFELVKIDVDANQALAQQMGVQGIPAVVAFVDGAPVNSFQGALPEAQVREWLSTFTTAGMSDDLSRALDLLDRGDEAGAETALKQLVAETADREAALTLATLYIDQERFADAVTLLESVEPGPDVDQLRSIASLAMAADGLTELEAKLADDPANVDLQIQHAVAIAGAGRTEEALTTLLEIVHAGGDEREDARIAMISVFDGLGPSHPLATEYRKRLANALF